MNKRLIDYKPEELEQEVQQIMEQHKWNKHIAQLIRLINRKER